MVKKQKGKGREDMRRRAKKFNTSVGDIVLLLNIIFPNKLLCTFDPTEYKVLERNIMGEY